ncbi:MAG: DUF11 domain-containing protein [Sedimentisphaerales bacterium]|nr:DUF11 domain-containing protein [Sedimentisphaerales bacterium]
MKRLVTISNLLLVVILISVVGCRCGRRSRERLAGQRSVAFAGDLGDATEIKLRPAPAPVSAVASAGDVAELMPAVSGSAAVEPAVLNGSGQYVLSRIYPCRACGTVQLDKTMPNQVELGKTMAYSMRVTNLTSAGLSGIVVNEQLPDKFELSSASPTAQQDGKNLIWKIDSLGPKATVEITVSGKATEMESLKYCTNVTIPAVAACSTVQVIHPKLKLTRIAPEGILVCEPIEVRYVLENTGTGAAEGIKIVETLPDGLATSDGKSELVIDAGKVPAGQVKEFAAKLQALRKGQYVSKAVASSANGLQAESAPATIVVDKPLLSVAVSAPDKQYLGRPITYDITLTNMSDAPAKDAVIEDAIPDDVKSMKASAGAKLSGRKIVWLLGTLAPKASQTVQVSFEPTREGVLSNNVSATAACADTVTASAQTALKSIPAVLLEVIDVTDPVEVGTRTTYVITVTNQGSAPSTNITVVCGMEDNVRYVSSSGSSIGAIEDGVLKFAPLESLAPKAKATWRVIVTALKEGDTRFKTTMNTDELTRPVEETEATRIYE